MNFKKDKITGLLYIGTGIGIIIATILIILFYLVYIDMASNEPWTAPQNDSYGIVYNEPDS